MNATVTAILFVLEHEWGFRFESSQLIRYERIHYRTENMSASCGMFESPTYRLVRQNRRHEEAFRDGNRVLQAARQQPQPQPK